jgi:integrase
MRYIVLVEESGEYNGSWADPSAARRPFTDWVDAWWVVWSSRPGLSPHTLQMAESRVRRHIRPYFARRRLGSLDVQAVRVWQNDLQRRAGYPTVTACRSLLNRILQAAVHDRLLAFNPMSRVAAPKRPVDPEVVFGHVRRRAYTPEEFGRLLAVCPAFYRDHFLVQVGTGLRPGELLGLHAFRVNLVQERIEVQHVRYDAGTFGSGYKDRPKSTAGLRSVPMAPLVAEAVGRRLVDCPGGRAGVLRPGWQQPRLKGVRSQLSAGNYRRVYKQTVAKLDLDGMDLRGPHDLRHTFATWLEDAGIPARIIDELMGHRAGRPGVEHGSAIGASYRHTTPEMEARVRAAVQERLRLVLHGVPRLCPDEGDIA